MILDFVPTKRRPRFARGRAYDCKENVEEARRIREEYERQDGRFFTGAVELEVVAFRDLPSSRPKRVESEPDTFKPDVDNIAKAVMDALNGVAYADDKQVTRLRVVKVDRARRHEFVQVSIKEA